MVVCFATRHLRFCSICSRYLQLGTYSLMVAVALFAPKKEQGSEEAMNKKIVLTIILWASFKVSLAIAFLNWFFNGAPTGFLSVSEVAPRSLVMGSFVLAEGICVFLSIVNCRWLQLKDKCEGRGQHES